MVHWGLKTTRCVAAAFLVLSACGALAAESESGTAPSSQGSQVLREITICRDRSLGKTKTGWVRTLRVYEGADQSCRATYSKSEGEQTVGENRSNKQCRSILDGIKKTLETSNWSCKKMESVSVLESTAVKAPAAATKTL